MPIETPRRSPYAALTPQSTSESSRPQTTAEFFVDRYGPHLFELLLIENRDKAVRGFRLLWNHLRRSPTSRELLKLAARRGRGREKTVSDRQKKAVALAIDWGGMSVQDVLEALGKIKPGEKVVNRERSWLDYRRDQGRILCDPNTYAKALRLDFKYSRRELCLMELEASRSNLL
jgi:hypothetical protein